MLGFGTQTQRKEITKWIALITGLFTFGPIAGILGLGMFGMRELVMGLTLMSIIGLINLVVAVWYFTREL